ncbi:MAG: hypothetical protein KF864_00550 [Phycisphaeraceae bacterium]|nr:hypothetical protein [Phycisphaeraceae bacterium]
MNPIRPTGGPDPTPNLSGPSSSTPAGRVEPFSVSPASGVGASSPAAPVDQARFDRIAGTIRTGLSAGHTRDQIMDRLIADETQARFGSAATPQMTASVAESFRTDPALSQLVSRLFAASQRTQSQP